MACLKARWLLPCVFLFLLGGTIEVMAAGPHPDFRIKYQVSPEPADWVELTAQGLLTGSENRVRLLQASWPHDPLWSGQLPLDVVDGVSIGHLIYFSHGNGTLSRLDLRTFSHSPVRTQKNWQGGARLDFDGNFLLVGVGQKVHRFALTQDAYCGPPGLLSSSLGDSPLLWAGSRVLDREIEDLAVWQGRILFSERGGKAWLAGRDGGGESEAVPGLRENGFIMADNNYTYAGGHEGLWLAPAPGERSWPAFQLPVTALDLQAAGRDLYVASGKSGLQLFYNVMEPKATFQINQVGISWSPNAVTISEGDTVQWNYGTSHNVVETIGEGSCVTKTGGYTSGPAGSSTTYSRMFSTAGMSYFKCNPHGCSGMTGTITIEAAATSPPGVPDGETGNAMTASRPQPDDGSVTVVWDDSTCTSDGFHLIYGGGSDLPASQGGTYLTDGGECTLGSSSPFTWSSTPDPALDSSGFIWWLILANDGAGTEGTWGTDSSGNQRNGSGGGGSSAQCSNTAKDTTETCGL